MPELPEVETTKRGVAPHVVGRKLQSIVVRQPQLRWPVLAELAALVEGQPLLSINRRGKYLLFEFPSGVLMVHLGMSGSLRVVERREDPGFHDHVDMDFGRSRVLRYHDPRRFGAFVWAGADWQNHALIHHLGPEPLTEDFSVDYLYQRSRKRRQAIKSFIMDSKVVVGVGNIYANEALFKAGISPLRQAGAVSRARYEALVDEIKKTLAGAIEQGGTTLRDFVGGDGKPGYFQQQLLVYGRAGEACKQCSKALKEVRLGQRSTVYCTQCQR